MKTLKIGYAYLFYFLYNTVNKKGNPLVVWKSIFIMLILEGLLILSTVYQYENFTKSRLFTFSSFTLLCIFIPLALIKLWFFERNRNWEKYIDEFRAWPVKKQMRWNWIMRGIVILVFVNLISAFYWMSEIDWNQYR